jgi:hypothetical protein
MFRCDPFSSPLDEKTFVSTLEQVTAQTMPPVEKHRVSHRQPVHPSAQVRSVRPGDKVDMIPHQHKAENRHVKARSRLP